MLELRVVVVIERILNRDQSIRQPVNLLAPHPSNKAHHSAYIMSNKNRRADCGILS